MLEGGSHKYHRITEILRFCEETSKGTSGNQPDHPYRSEKGQLEQVAQYLLQLGLEYLHSLAGQPVLLFDHPQSKEDFSCI